MLLIKLRWRLYNTFLPLHKPQNEVGKAIYQKLHSNVKINSSYSEGKQMKMQLCMITQLKKRAFFFPFTNAQEARKCEANASSCGKCFHNKLCSIFLLSFSYKWIYLFKDGKKFVFPSLFLLLCLLFPVEMQFSLLIFFDDEIAYKNVICRTISFQFSPICFIRETWTSLRRNPSSRKHSQSCIHVKNLSLLFVSKKTTKLFRSEIH